MQSTLSTRSQKRKEKERFSRHAAVGMQSIDPRPSTPQSIVYFRATTAFFCENNIFWVSTLAIPDAIVVRTTGFREKKCTCDRSYRYFYHDLATSINVPWQIIVGRQTYGDVPVLTLPFCYCRYDTVRVIVLVALRLTEIPETDNSHDIPWTRIRVPMETKLTVFLYDFNSVAITKNALYVHARGIIEYNLLFKKKKRKDKQRNKK